MQALLIVVASVVYLVTVGAVNAWCLDRKNGFDLKNGPFPLLGPAVFPALAGAALMRRLMAPKQAQLPKATVVKE